MECILDTNVKDLKKDASNLDVKRAGTACFWTERWNMEKNILLLSLVAIIACIACGCMQKTDADPSESDTRDAPRAIVQNRMEKDNGAVVTHEETAPADAPVNLIWIVLDACRAKNLSCYENFRKTSPCIDKLAAYGTIFKQTFAQSTHTSFSVPSYMTGRYFPVPCLSGRFSVSSAIRQAPAGEILFAETMKANGYATVLFDAHPLFESTDRLAQSFDEFVKVPMDFALKCPPKLEELTGAICSWIDAHKDMPFFAYVHAMDVHFPIILSPPYDRWIDKEYSSDSLNYFESGQTFSRKDGEPFHEEDIAYFNALYDGAIWGADDQIAAIVQHVETLGLSNRTIFVIGSDHGQALGEDGYNVCHSTDLAYDELLRVPLVMHGPGIPAGKKVESLVENVDIVPTLAGLLGLETRARYDGMDLTPLLTYSGEYRPREYIFAAPFRTFYDNINSLIVRNNSFRYEEYLTSPLRQLWKMPDSYTSEQNLLAGSPGIAGPFREALLKFKMRYWEPYLSLPVEAYILHAAWMSAFRVSGDIAEANHFLPAKPKTLCEDGQWACTDGQLWCAPFAEECSALQFRFPIPQGAYRIFIKFLNDASHDGHPASAFEMKIQGAPEPIRIIQDNQPHDAARFETAPLGTHNAGDGYFDFSLAPLDRKHWVCIQKIVFLPEGAQDDAASILKNEMLAPKTHQQTRDIEEALQALGYI